jgi:predicted transcriptional regulator
MTKTIQMTLDESLLARVDEMVETLDTTRSAFIRRALEEELRRQHILELERRDREGYAKDPEQPGEFDVWHAEQAWGDEWDEKAWSEHEKG